ncbi:MAG: threonyl-tRNA synthetase editing domain-containing protein, partial [Candidatus Thorarchaeota archaeon]
LQVLCLRLLMFHVESFWYRANESDDEKTSLDESIIVWIHSEETDEGNRPSVLRKMVKNIRWLAKKVECTTVILHSFAHLDDSKATPDFADVLIEEVAERLRARDFDVHIVPFGHFYEFNLHVKGPSLAKVFKKID